MLRFLSGMKHALLILILWLTLSNAYAQPCLENLSVMDLTIAEQEFQRGLKLIQQRRVAQAIPIFQHLIKILPDLPSAYNNLAVLYAEQGDYDQALALLDEALKQHEAYQALHINVRAIYAQKASQVYRTALAIQLDEQQLPELTLLSELNTLPNSPACPPTTLAANNSSGLAAATQLDTALFDNDIVVEQIKTTVQAWASAWSQQNINAYLGYYSEQFLPADGTARTQWVQQRQQRLRVPSFIKVSLSQFEIDLLNENTARVQFFQRYQSNYYRDEVNKMLFLQNEQGVWLIVHENEL